MATIEERVEALEAALAAARGQTVPEDTVEVSFPNIGYGLTASMWQQIALGIGDGILDDDGGPYYIENPNNALNTVDVRPSAVSGQAQALVRGFCHRITEPVPVTIPSAAGNYIIGIMYDPAGQGQPQGPLTLQVWQQADTFTDGRIAFPLHLIPRGSNDTMIDAYNKRVSLRRMLAPQIYAEKESLPPTTNVLWGTTAIDPTTGISYRADVHDGWIPVNSPEWQNLYLPNARAWAGFGYRPQYRVRMGVVELRGVFKRVVNGADSTFFAGEQYHLATIPGVGSTIPAPPAVKRYSGLWGIRTGDVLIQLDGMINARPGSNVSTIAIDDCRMDFEP